MELHMKLWCLNKGKKLTARVFAKILFWEKILKILQNYGVLEL